MSKNFKWKSQWKSFTSHLILNDLQYRIDCRFKSQNKRTSLTWNDLAVWTRYHWPDDDLEWAPADFSITISWIFANNVSRVSDLLTVDDNNNVLQALTFNQSSQNSTTKHSSWTKRNDILFACTCARSVALLIVTWRPWQWQLLLPRDLYRLPI